MTPTVNLVTLGCSKNLVDTRAVAAGLSREGFNVVVESNEPADVVVINTCGFIGDAKEESVNTILEFVQQKAEGRVGHVVVMGCLSERYRDDLAAEIPEIDRLYGKFDWKTLAADLRQAYNLPAPEPSSATKPHSPGIDFTPEYPGMAYVKIAEGCNRFCAFCAIPLITGRYKSRPMEDIEDEVRSLVAQGVDEFNIIAQDLSAYGTDLYDGRLMLPALIDRLAQIPGVEWLRLHYAYPAQFPMEIMDVMARHPNVCSYIDIALQHISDRVLSNMRRHITAAQTVALLSEMRKRVPGLHIRTTLMVGFPGEEQADFEQLLEFVRTQRFERLGAFAYCEEEGTFGQQHLSDNISQEEKQRRLDRLMALQEEISLEIQQEKVGRTLRVKIDSEEPDFYIARTEWDSPEVDPQVLVKKTRPLELGEYINVKIEEALPFELIAIPT